MYLEWLDIEGQVARCPLDPNMEPVSIGRSPGSTIYSKETSVSRNHGRIGWDVNGYYIKDLGSSNGTFINGERTQRGNLREGDVARCGEVLEIRLKSGDMPGQKKKTLQLQDPNPADKNPVDKSASQDRAILRKPPPPTGALSREERDALVAQARAARLGQHPEAMRTDARPHEDSPQKQPAPQLQQVREPSRPQIPAQKQPDPVRQGSAPRPDPRVLTPPSPLKFDAKPLDATSKPPTLQALHQDAAKRIAQLEQELAATQASLRKAETDGKAGEARSMRYSVELDGLSDKYVKLKEHNQLLSQELERSRRDARKFEDEAFEAKRLAEELQSQMSQAREKAADATEQLSGLKVRITQKDRQIEELQRQLDLLEFELRQARDENESLQSSFNREGGDMSRLERKVNLLQEVIQEKEAQIEQLRLDLRAKDVEIRQVRMGVGISDLEHEKRRLLEDYHQATRRVDELNDRLLQQARQTDALRVELDAAKELADRKPAQLADVTEHPDFKAKIREVERTREEISQLQRDLAKAELKLEAAQGEQTQHKNVAAEMAQAHKRAELAEEKLHEAEIRLNEALTVTKTLAVPPGLADDLETLLDSAVAARSNAAVVRRYAAQLEREKGRWPEVADTLELLHDISTVLAQDLAEQAKSVEQLHRVVAAPVAASVTAQTAAAAGENTGETA